jgi:hypothetical protein
VHGRSYFLDSRLVAAGRPRSFSIRAHGFSVGPGYSSPATRLVLSTERPVGDSLFQSGELKPHLWEAFVCGIIADNKQLSSFGSIQFWNCVIQAFSAQKLPLTIHQLQDLGQSQTCSPVRLDKRRCQKQEPLGLDCRLVRYCDTMGSFRFHTLLPAPLRQNQQKGHGESRLWDLCRRKFCLHVCDVPRQLQAASAQRGHHGHRPASCPPKQPGQTG